MATSTGEGLPEPSCGPGYSLHRGQERYCGVTLYPLGPALPLTNRHSVLQGAVTSDTHPRFLGTLLSSASEEMLPQTNTRRFWGPPMTKGAPHAIWTSIVPYFHNTGWMMCLRG